MRIIYSVGTGQPGSDERRPSLQPDPMTTKSQGNNLDVETKLTPDKKRNKEGLNILFP